MHTVHGRNICTPVIENAARFLGSAPRTGFDPPNWLTKKVPTEVETLTLRGGGDEGDRTPDLLTASQALSQLSYAPKQQERTIRDEFGLRKLFLIKIWPSRVQALGAR